MHTDAQLVQYYRNECDYQTRCKNDLILDKENLYHQINDLKAEITNLKAELKLITSLEYGQWLQLFSSTL